MNAKLKARIGILTIALLIMGAMAITPSIANIAAAFPDVSNSVIQMVFSLTSLTSLLSAIAVGKLTVTVSKKKLVLTGIALMGIGGMIPYFYHSEFYFLLIGAAIIGLGLGSLSTLTPTFIADNFEGHERDATFGQMAAFVSLGSVLITVIGGKLAASGWVNNYLVYLVTVPLFIIAALTLPNKPILESHNPHGAGGSKPAIKLNAKVLLIGCVGFMFLMLFTALPNNLAMYMVTQQVGDGSNISTAFGIFLISGLFSGMLFGKISKFTASLTFSAAFIVFGAGTFIICTTTAVPVLLAGCFVAGFSISIFMARAPSTIACVVDFTSMPMAIAVYSAFTAIAAFCSPLIINTLAGYFGDASPKAALTVTGAMAFVVVLVLVATKFEKSCLEHKAKQKVALESETA